MRLKQERKKHFFCIESIKKRYSCITQTLFSEISDLASSIRILSIDIDAEANDDSGAEFRDIEF